MTDSLWYIKLTNNIQYTQIMENTVDYEFLARGNRRYQDAIEKAQFIKKQWEEMSAKFIQVMPKIEAYFAKMNMVVAGINGYKTGTEYDWNFGDCMRVSFKVTQADGKPVKFEFYKKHDKFAVVKAHHMTDELKKVTGLENVQVNSYSLCQDDRTASISRILIDIWVK